MATTTTSAGSTSSTTCAFTQTRQRSCSIRRSTRSSRESRGATTAVEALETAGYAMDDRYFVTALPPGFAIDSYHQDPVPAVHHIVEGDVVDLGDRHFEVLHLPGHSPGSIGLWEDRTGTLFSGDADLRRAAARRVGRVVDSRITAPPWSACWRFRSRSFTVVTTRASAAPDCTRSLAPTSLAAPAEAQTRRGAAR